MILFQCIAIISSISTSVQKSGLNYTAISRLASGNMSNEKWFLGTASRQKADELLNACGIDGSFVIRSSESVSGAYAISVLHCKNIHTYRILPTDNGLLAVQTLKGVQQRKFKCLDELVKEYKNPQNGLVCGLTNPVGSSDFSQPKVSVFEHSSDTRVELPPAPSTKTGATHVPIRVKSCGKTISPPRSTDAELTLLNDRKEATPRHLPQLPPLPSLPDSIQRVVSKSLDPSQHDTDVKGKLLARLDEIKSAWSGIDNNFMDSVQAYTNDGGLDLDVSNIRRGNDYCAELQTLLAKEAVGFQRELEVFITKTDILRQLFDHHLAVRKTRAYNRIQDTDVDLDAFLGRLRDCQTVVKSLNKKACNSVQSMLGLTTTVARASSRKSSKAHEVITERMFEVKQDGGLKFTKQKLKMDITKGTLSIMKSDGVVEYPHSKVLQLIKNNKSKNKLCIVFDGNKKKEFIFEKSFDREAFCQLMQHIRNKHNTTTDPDCVSIFCGSWNMGDAIPPNDISSWFRCNGSGKTLDQGMQTVPHDIYVVGTQETGMQERDWMHRVIETLQEITGGTFHLVVMDALWHIKIMVFVKEEHKNRISHVQTSTVKTGIANALGNKGAVAVSFQFGGTSFCFINAHLTSGAEKCTRRNNNYHDIIRNLNLGEDRFRIFDLTNRFDHLFFFGDLNYRLDMNVEEILSSIKNKDLAILHKVDQLRREKDSNKAFYGFDEEEITFPPTYRYERGNRDTYAHVKIKKTGVRINVPSWCDRILWRSYPETHNVCHAYGCSDDITTSDHSPLFSNFLVGVRGQYVSNEEIRNSSNKSGQSSITFENIETILKAPGKSSFCLQFHSLCLTSSVKSQKNQKMDTAGMGMNHARLQWSAMPTLVPIIADREFLVDQHLLICLRSDDDNEVHGECVIALRSMIGTTSQYFNERLSRKGEDVGEIRGRMLVKARVSENAPKEKTYDFIQIRKDDEELKKIKDMGVSVATYTAVEDIKPTVSPSHRSPLATPASRSSRLSSELLPNTMNASVGVYEENEEMGASEGVYADPDHIISTSPKRTSNFSPVSTHRFSTEISNHLANNLFSLTLDVEKAAKTVPVGHRSGSTDSPTILQNSTISPVPPNRISSPVPPQPIARKSFLSSQVPRMSEALTEVAMFDMASKTQNLSNSSPVFSRRGSSSSFASPSRSSPSREVSYSYDKLSYSDKSPALSNHSTYSGTHPMAPARKRSAPGRRIPGNVEEFLSVINLSQYNDILQRNGWDNMEFLGDLTEDDLIDIGITNIDHCHVILETIKSFGF